MNECGKCVHKAVCRMWEKSECSNAWSWCDGGVSSDGCPAMVPMGYIKDSKRGEVREQFRRLDEEFGLGLTK